MEQQQRELNQHRNILFSGHRSYQCEEQNTSYTSAGFVAVFQLWIDSKRIAFVSVEKINKHSNSLNYY